MYFPPSKILKVFVNGDSVFVTQAMKEPAARLILDVMAVMAMDSVVMEIVYAKEALLDKLVNLKPTLFHLYALMIAQAMVNVS